MLSRFLQCLCIVALVLSADRVSAQIGNALGTGKYGTFHSYSAFAMEPGYLSMYSTGRVYGVAGKTGYYLGNVRGVNLWHASNRLTFQFGYMKHFDALISIVTYQDLNIRTVRETKSRIFGDIYPSLRAGSIEVANGKISTGAAFTFKIPTGKYFNIPWEVYKSESFEFGLLTMATLWGNPYYKEQSYILNVNVGFWNHNDNGNWVIPTKVGHDSIAKSDVNAMHIQYSLGFIYPVSQAALMLDLHGVNFIQQPSKHVYSRESFIYITPGIKYNIRPWINVGMYVDLLVAGSKDESKYIDGSFQPPGVPNNQKSLANYSPWRFGMNLGINILPVSFATAPSETKRRRLLQQLLEEDKGAQKASYQLERLKDVRIKAEKELEKIRKELESGEEK